MADKQNQQEGCRKGCLRGCLIYFAVCFGVLALALIPTALISVEAGGMFYAVVASVFTFAFFIGYPIWWNRKNPDALKNKKKQWESGGSSYSTGINAQKWAYVTEEAAEGVRNRILMYLFPRKYIDFPLPQSVNVTNRVGRNAAKIACDVIYVYQFTKPFERDGSFVYDGFTVSISFNEGGAPYDAFVRIQNKQNSTCTVWLSLRSKGEAITIERTTLKLKDDGIEQVLYDATKQSGIEQHAVLTKTHRAISKLGKSGVL